MTLLINNTAYLHMKQVYTIEIARYPLEFVIEAENEESAKAQAQEMFFEKTENASIYETTVIDVQ